MFLLLVSDLSHSLASVYALGVMSSSPVLIAKFRDLWLVSFSNRQQGIGTFSSMRVYLDFSKMDVGKINNINIQCPLSQSVLVMLKPPAISEYLKVDIHLLLITT